MKNTLEEKQTLKCPYDECDGSGYYKFWRKPDDSVMLKCRCLLEREEDKQADDADDRYKEQ